MPRFFHGDGKAALTRAVAAFEAGTAAELVSRSSGSCPNCGAPLDRINMAGNCEACGTHLTRGEFDWVLSKIEQDDSYSDERPR